MAAIMIDSYTPRQRNIDNPWDNNSVEKEPIVPDTITNNPWDNNSVEKEPIVPDTITKEDLGKYIKLLQDRGVSSLKYGEVGKATEPFVGEVAAFNVTRDMGKKSFLAATLRASAVVMDIDPDRPYPVRTVILPKAGGVPMVYIPASEYEQLGTPRKGDTVKRVQANVIVVVDSHEKEDNVIPFTPEGLNRGEAALFDPRNIVLSEDGRSARIVAGSAPVKITGKADAPEYLKEHSGWAAVEWRRTRVDWRNDGFEDRLCVRRVTDPNTGEEESVPVEGFIASAPDRSNPAA